jgi:hypothetical protein
MEAAPVFGAMRFSRLTFLILTSSYSSPLLCCRTFNARNSVCGFRRLEQSGDEWGTIDDPETISFELRQFLRRLRLHESYTSHIQNHCMVNFRPVVSAGAVNLREGFRRYRAVQAELYYAAILDCFSYSEHLRLVYPR